MQPTVLTAVHSESHQPFIKMTLQFLYKITTYFVRKSTAGDTMWQNSTAAKPR